MVWGKQTRVCCLLPARKLAQGRWPRVTRCVVTAVAAPVLPAGLHVLPPLPTFPHFGPEIQRVISWPYIFYFLFLTFAVIYLGADNVSCRTTLIFLQAGHCSLFFFSELCTSGLLPSDSHQQLLLFPKTRQHFQSSQATMCDHR